MKPHEFHTSAAVQDVKNTIHQWNSKLGDIPSTVGTPSIPGTPSIVGGTLIPSPRSVPGMPRTTQHATPHRNSRSTFGDTSISTQESIMVNTGTPNSDVTSTIPGSIPSISGGSTPINPSSVSSTPSTGTPVVQKL